jgi:hypothetical protein
MLRYLAARYWVTMMRDLTVPLDTEKLGPTRTAQRSRMTWRSLASRHTVNFVADIPHGPCVDGLDTPGTRRFPKLKLAQSPRVTRAHERRLGFGAAHSGGEPLRAHRELSPRIDEH